MNRPLRLSELARRVQRSATIKPKRKFDPMRHRRPSRAGVVSMQRSPLAMEPETLDSNARTVRALAFTEAPVQIYDWKSDRIVGEVLTVKGMRPVDSVRLLDAHSRYAAASVLGSALDFREESATDSTARGGSLTLQFSAASDVEPIWTRVKEGHLRGVSIGGSYTRGAFTEIEPGGSFTFEGVKYTAKDMPLRIVTDWELVEVSVVPIPADATASIRSRQTETQPAKSDSNPSTGGRVAREKNSAAQPASLGEITMNFSVRALRFLRSLGLAATATHDQAVAFARALPTEQLEELFATSRRARLIVNGETQRSAQTPASTQTNAEPPANNGGQANNEPSAEDVRRAERERINAIDAMSDGVPAELVQRARNENWSVEQAGLRFFQAIQRQTPPGVGNDSQRGTPGIHIQRGATLETLQVAILQKHNISPDSEIFRSDAGRALLGRHDVNAGWLCEAARAREDGRQVEARFARAIDEGYRYRSYSAVDICREVLRLSGKTVPVDREEVIERAMSLSALNRVFGTAVNARIVSGYITYDDSTRGWCAEQDWTDHRTNQPVLLNATKGLKKRNSGVKSEDVEFSDAGQTYNVDPFCGKFEIDIVDIRNDQAGFTGTAPEALGQMAAEVRPNLVYGLILANATLSDGYAVFSTSRTNSNDISSSPLNNANLSAAEQRMASFVATAADGSVKPLNYMAGFLVAPRALRQTAIREARSPLLVSGNTTAAGNTNPHQGEWAVRSDARLDVGFTHPGTGAALTGSTTKWYIIEASGRRAVSVGYLAGTGRAPMIRSGRFNAPGQYGLWWDVEMPLGAGILSPEAIVRSAA